MDCVRGPGVVEELPDDCVHLLDVRLHALLFFFREVGQLDLQAHARQRRAQVVRNAGQNEGAIGFDAVQVMHHLVEAPVGFDHFAGSGFRQRFGLLPLSQSTGCESDLRQRLTDQL